MRPLLVALALLARAATAAPTPAAMSVLELSGGPLTVGGAAWGLGDRLPPGRSARLARGGRLVLAVPGWGSLLLHGPAVFSAERGGGLRLTAGGALAVPLGREARRLAVRMPAAVAAAREATFYVEVRGEDSVYLCACAGSVHVASDSGAFTTTVAARGGHTPFLFQFVEGHGLQSASSLVRHSDEEIEALGDRSAKAAARLRPQR